MFDFKIGWAVLLIWAFPSGFSSVEKVNDDGKAPSSSHQPKAKLTQQVDIPEGKFMMGSPLPQRPGQAHRADGSGDPREVKVKAFSIDPVAVSNDQFLAFVEDTGYLTHAENYTWSFVMEYLLDPETLAESDGETGLGRVKGSEHWVGVIGADWRHPEGPRLGDVFSSSRGSHPVLHVSHLDARRYCKWAGRRLPTEEEWEYAARGGRRRTKYPWGGNKAGPDDLNYFQGEFPKTNSAEDGYLSTAPVDAFDENDFGLYNMAGNVWEWVRGGSREKRILKGGSYTDSLDGSFNHAITVASRMELSEDSGSANTGFRCASSKIKLEKKAPEAGVGSAEL